MTEYVWTSPGGVYTVPADWRAAFLAEFPDYRIRWSLKTRSWHLEQRCGSNTLAPFRIDPFDDSLIRAADGYWLVMVLQPGNRMPCPSIVARHPRQLCGWTVSVPTRVTAEAICTNCRSHGRDGRFMAAYYPFDETLLDWMRQTNPLNHGVQKIDGKTRVMASVEADRRNQRALKEGDRKQSDAITSIDSVDYRWITGIGSSGATRRRVDSHTFR